MTRPARSARTRTAVGLVVLLGLTLYFDHRLYGALTTLEGDAPQAVYYWLHHHVLEAGYDPAQRDYFALLPVHGLHNPLRTALVGITKILAPAVSPVVLALVGNMTLAFVLHFAVAAGCFLFLRALGRSVGAALIGSSLVAFTGFHLVGVREFDHMYLMSFAGLFPAFLSLSRLAVDGQHVVRRTAAAALAIGLSLLGGSNVPLFLYLPFAFLTPFAVFARHRSLRLLGIGLAGALVASGAGVLIGSPTLVDGLAAVAVQTRQQLLFGQAPLLRPMNQLRTILLRDWWSAGGGIHYHERDLFLGAPVLVLALLGLGVLAARLRSAWRDRSAPAEPSLDGVVGVVMLAVGALSLAVLNLHRLPAFVQAAIGAYYQAQSIRFPGRFGLLLLVPVAYLASLGFDRLSRRELVPIAAIVVTVTAGLAAAIPGNDLMRRVPDARLAAALSLGASAIALAALLWRWRSLRQRREQPIAVALAVAGIFAGFLFAPIQATSYTLWYFFGASRDAAEPAPRLGLARVLGLSPDYGRIIRAAELMLTVPPPHLRDPRTRDGRIFDATTAVSHYHGYATGHAFVFTTTDDPANHVYLTDLFRRMRAEPALTDRVLDLAGVRWIVGYSSAERPVPSEWLVTFGDVRQRPLLIERPPAPAVRFTPRAKAVHDLDDFLTAVRGAATGELRFTVYLACDGRCPDVSGGAVDSSARRAVAAIDVEPWRRVYGLEPGAPGYVFLSIPYHRNWEALVNGRPAPVFRADHAFMAIPVGGAQSMIELRFDHRRRDVARAISGVLIAACGVALLARRRLVTPVSTET